MRKGAISDSPGIYDLIGTGYNNTRKADPFISERLLELLAPMAGETYLDIGCGTGNYTMAMAGEGYAFYGVDPSVPMLGEARLKSSKVHWVQGSSEKIPFADSFFAGAMATLTIHHWKDLNRSFAELSRVLKPNSRLVVFTSLPEQMNGYWLNHYFPEMMKDSIVRMPALDVLISASSSARLRLAKREKYFVHDTLEDLFLYAGKHHPEIYFDPVVRGGMSSFTALSNKDEVTAGLQHLRKDLDKDQFKTVKQQYANDLGDYSFFSFIKETAP